MNETLLKVRRFFVSLKLTVTLLVLGIILIFWATLAQVELGVWGVQERFFYKVFIAERIPGTGLWAPFVGGYFIGTLLMLNLVAAHIDRFKLTTRKLGIQLTHAGVIVLLLGELLSGLWQESYTMQIPVGESLNYAEHQRNFELALINTSAPDVDKVVAIPDKLVSELKPIQHPDLPFQVVPRQFFPNGRVVRRESAPEAPPSGATEGIGPGVATNPLPITYRDDEANLPVALVELIGTTGSLGTWVVSPDVIWSRKPDNTWGHEDMPAQSLTVDGQTWNIVLRRERSYLVEAKKPFKIELLEVTHDVYPGTSTPKDFASRVRLVATDGSENREVRIYMNNPLRYAGLTFYQYQMNAPEKYTVFQVVQNPSWILPYVACIMISLGLIWQFGAHLLGFIKKRRSLSPAAV